MTCAVSGVFDLVNKCHPSTIHYIIRRPGSNFDINHSNNFGQTPMMFAAATREPKIAEKIIEYLIGYGADFERKDAFGRDILFYSVIFGLDDVTIKLLNSGYFDLLHQDIEGRTILFHAVSYNRVDIVRFLCSMKGADGNKLRPLMHLQDKYGCNVFQLAASLGHHQCLKLLLYRNRKQQRGSFSRSNISSNYTLNAPPPQIFINNLYNQTSSAPEHGHALHVSQLNLPCRGVTSAPQSGSHVTMPSIPFRRGQNIRKSMELLLNLQAHRNLPTFRTDSKVLAAGDCVPPQRGSPLTRSSPALPGQQISVQDEEIDAYLVTEMRFKQAEREKRKLLRRGTESEIQSPRPSRKTSSLQQLPRLSRSDSILQQ